MKGLPPSPIKSEESEPTALEDFWIEWGFLISLGLLMMVLLLSCLLCCSSKQKQKVKRVIVRQGKVKVAPDREPIDIVIEKQSLTPSENISMRQSGSSVQNDHKYDEPCKSDFDQFSKMTVTPSKPNLTPSMSADCTPSKFSRMTLPERGRTSTVDTFLALERQQSEHSLEERGALDFLKRYNDYNERREMSFTPRNR